MLAYGLACVISSMAALMLLHRQSAFKSSGEAPPAGRSMLVELRFSVRLLGLALPFAIALFVFFPRWGSPLWGVPENALDAKSGLSDSMTPGSIQALFMDDSPAFRADFESPVPVQSDLYWRGPVFWEFDGQTWNTNYFSLNVPAETAGGVDLVLLRIAVLGQHEERVGLELPARP